MGLNYADTRLDDTQHSPRIFILPSVHIKKQRDEPLECHVPEADLSVWRKSVKFHNITVESVLLLIPS